MRVASDCDEIALVGHAHGIWSLKIMRITLNFLDYLFRTEIIVLISDIDKCAPAPCHNGGACTDGVNAYTCSCATGYGGNNCETSKYFSI